MTMVSTATLGSPSSAATPRTLVDILRATAARHPDAVALDEGPATLTYRELIVAVDAQARRLATVGVGPGSRVGIRLPSGTHLLYVAILGVLAAGAAYVPVDADDPEERARLVFGEAGVQAVLEPGSPLLARAAGDRAAEDRAAEDRAAEDGAAEDRAAPGEAEPSPPGLDDDAWIIFTSGSTGTPKGVAVSHRSAAAFVDAEARLFLRPAPLGPRDRVLAGLSVAFDASCEEMWLAWRHGACLVPAPRALVRSGMDLGPWLVQRGITVVSTVPTLAALWPHDCLDRVRLLIFGGEACPPELAERVTDESSSGREVWNTYGPTEATVVACAARLNEDGPVRIGLPLDGWELAVVDARELPVAPGEVGQLIIGGVGLARYLDPAKDAEKFAAMPTLGWARAYRSGDLVRFDGDGLRFQGRSDEQVKLGGRRIELGEVDAAMQSLPGVAGAAAAVRSTNTGNQILVGYVAPAPGVDFDLAGALAQLRERLPAALVPVLAVVEELPTRTSGKVDRDALPWPLTSVEDQGEHGLEGTEGWLADQWVSTLGANIGGGDDDFFAHGGGSLSAAQLVSVLRNRFPQTTVADVYAYPRLGDLAAFLDASAPAASRVSRDIAPVPRWTQAVQLLVTVVLSTVTGLRWLTTLAALNNVLGWSSGSGGHDWAPRVSWWWVLVGAVLFVSPFGRMAIAAAGARILLRGLRPGTYPRGGSVHLRLWSAERLAEAVGAANLAGAPWIASYARALGAKVGAGVDLHTLPPITGMLTLGRECSVEPEVDLSGYWIDGDDLHVGRVRVGAGATVGARSTLAPGVKIGKGAQIEPGSWVTGFVPDGERWAGSPAERVGRVRSHAPVERPPRPARWVPVYAVTSALFSLLPVIAALPGIVYVGRSVRDAHSLSAACGRALLAVPGATVSWLVVYAVLTWAIVRLLGRGLVAGYFPVRSRIGWQAWATERVMDLARSLLFPLYSSMFTPIWLRALGATIGTNVEASTVLMLPTLTTVGDGAFLADDTMIAFYELDRGWLHIAEAKVGKRAFLGNSGMAGPGRNVPKNGLIAVLSAAPAKARKGTSWLGSPPVELRRTSDEADHKRTFAPPRRLRLARAVVELARIVPVMVTVALGLGVLLALEWLYTRTNLIVAGAAGGLVLLGAGVLAAATTTLAKWLLVGRLRAVEHPLWSSFVWRNELADTFVETVAAPWFARGATGTVLLTVWLRSLGARIGRGVWCETYWLPEADLVRLGDGATVNRGCVLQTHLFHDRIMRMDTVELGDGATMGPHGVILPAARIGSAATVGPASLVMRGDEVPASSRWIGNPIAPWA